jgi:nuclear pore complex protein Nup85
MREYLLGIGSTTSIEAGSSASTEKSAEDGEGDKDIDLPVVPEEGMDVVAKVKKETSKKLHSSVEDVLAACAMYGLEDVARSVCLVSVLRLTIDSHGIYHRTEEVACVALKQMTAESLIAQQKYGLAVAYCVRANDARRINKICDLILDEYVLNGEAALSLIDSIPTSLLRPSPTTASAAVQSSYEFFSPTSPMHNDRSADHDMDPTTGEMHQNALLLVKTTRLGFLARYRDFHALYASGDRIAAAELLTLLMSSNVAPKKFWAIMLLDSVALLNGE